MSSRCSAGDFVRVVLPLPTLLRMRRWQPPEKHPSFSSGRKTLFSFFQAVIPCFDSLEITRQHKNFFRGLSEISFSGRHAIGEDGKGLTNYFFKVLKFSRLANVMMCPVFVK